MPINGMQILSGATLSATGGTAKTFDVDGMNIANGVHVADLSVADFKLRPGITVKARMPQRLANGTWQKGKFSAVITVPRLRSDGATVDYPLIRIEQEMSDESTIAEMTELRKQAAQLLFDTDMTQFWDSGNKS